MKEELLKLIDDEIKFHKKVVEGTPPEYAEPFIKGLERSKELIEYYINALIDRINK